MKLKMIIVLLCILTLFFFSCEDSGINRYEKTLELEDVIGTYSLSELTKIENGSSTDVMSLGVNLSIKLNSDYTTTGIFFIPGNLDLIEDGNGEDLMIDLSGTFTKNLDTIRFQNDADTYIRDAVWLTDGNRIETEDFAHTVLIKL